MALWPLARHACAVKRLRREAFAPPRDVTQAEGRALSARRLDQPLKPAGSLRQACISSALIPGAGLRGIRREAKNAKVPEHDRIKGRAEQERSMRITGGRSTAQHQTRRHDVTVLQVVLSALEECSDLRTI